jgi:hypothetical protein
MWQPVFCEALDMGDDIGKRNMLVVVSVVSVFIVPAGMSLIRSSDFVSLSTRLSGRGLHSSTSHLTLCLFCR